uniref:Uncharacterized protein n=1 Tax=Romanomermis culicivorax TaxID=13658 RepID=A0A915JCR1_ROMCU
MLMPLLTLAPNVQCCCPALLNKLLTNNRFHSPSVKKSKWPMEPSSSPMVSLLLQWNLPFENIAACDKVLEEIAEEERVSFCDDKSDTFSQVEEIEAEQLVGHPSPSLYQTPPWPMEVTELAEPIFLIAQASITTSLNCQQWVTGTIFPSTSASIPHLIFQPLTNNQVAIELPVETVIVNITILTNGYYLGPHGISSPPPHHQTPMVRCHNFSIVKLWPNSSP